MTTLVIYWNNQGFVDPVMVPTPCTNTETTIFLGNDQKLNLFHKNNQNRLVTVEDEKLLRDAGLRVCVRLY